MQITYTEASKKQMCLQARLLSQHQRDRDKYQFSEQEKGCTRRLPTFDLFSIPSTGAPFLNHAWLSKTFEFTMQRQIEIKGKNDHQADH